ncbi:SVP26 [Sanghuangporus weigelae]
MSLLHLLSYVGIVAAAAFVILSLASGLLWISELIEEHSRAAKAVGTRAVYAIILLHILLYFTDSLPVLHTLFSITAHLIYLQNFSHTWPFISLASPAFLASCILAILNHFAWFFYFSRVSREVQAMRSQRVFRGNVHAHGNGGGVTAPGFQDIATFFALCVWFVPLFLFLSLSANDNALPMSANGFDSPTRANAPSRVISTSRSSLFKSILDLFPFLRRRRDRTDGILVTHTPSHSAPSTPRTSYSGQNPYTAASATSRTSFETAYPLSSPGPSPSLRPPPKRTSTGPASAHSSSFLGSPRTPDEGWTVVGGENVRSTATTSASSSTTTTTTSLFVSRSTEQETPVRRRTVAE